MRWSSPALLATAAAAIGLASALPHALEKRCENPVVDIATGKVTGFVDENYGLEQFFGIPFAKTPTGDLRFAKPQPIEGWQGDIDATRFGDICMQPGAPTPLYNMSENCLNLNVVRPQGVSEGDNLPVMVWVYGGAFFQGSIPAYNASELVQKGAQLGKPMVFVAANYRIGPFGFIGGSEIADSDSATPNAALYDQRLAFKWIQDNIGKFGGDAGRVTLFGQSAGAMSVALQTFAYDGDTQGLYHAAIMDSGGIAPGPLLNPKHPAVEKSFSDLAAGVGCTTAPLLPCLRKANATNVQNVGMGLTAKAGGTFPIAGALAWLPLVDCELITNYPHINLPQGKLADIPVIQGNNLNEGPLFAQKMLNSSSDFETWVRTAATIYNNSDTEEVLTAVFEAYPDVPEEGSPYYNEGTATSANTTYDLESRVFPPLESNQYKRSGAFFGDFTFQAHRRTYLAASMLPWRENKSKTWSFLFAQNDMYANGTGSALGPYHGAELKYLFGRPDGRNKDPVLAEKMPAAYISFVNYHDPTVLSGLPWPKYEDGQMLLQIKGDNITQIPDTYRKEAMEALTNSKAAAVFGF